MGNKENKKWKTLTYYGSGQRIDAWLTSKFAYSRNFFQHILESQRVRVETSKWKKISPKKSYKLQDGDVVTIESLERFMDGGVLEEAPILNIKILKDEKIQKWENVKCENIIESTNNKYLTIYLEKEDYMVIYKPKGVLSHPNSVWDISHPSVVGGLYHYMKSHKLQATSCKQKKNPLPSTASFIRAGLIHRLDKETDGLMLIAKTEKWLKYFKNLFQQKSLCDTREEKEQVPLKKYYRAVCDMSEQWRVFLDSIWDTFPYIIDEVVKPKVPHVREWKKGITKIIDYRHAELDSVSPDMRSWLSSGWRIEIGLEILTGRTHQIRYHLSEKGLPIVGDYLYNKNVETLKRWNVETLPMQLTAWKLAFLDGEGESVEIEI